MSSATFFSSFYKVIVVQVGAYETMELAWQRHLRDHPEDNLSRVRIFHFEHRELSQTLSFLEKTEKFTPSSDAVAPRGKL